MAHDRCNYFSYWAIFCPFSPLTAQEIKIKKKIMKKIPGDFVILHRDITILHNCTKNHDHILYCSWDMAYDRCNCYFSFWAIFCPFTLLTAWKIKISKKWKKHLEISPFYISVLKLMIMYHTVPEMWHVTDVIVIFHFGLFFARLAPNSLKNQNFIKMKKFPGYIIILHMYTKKYD